MYVLDMWSVLCCVFHTWVLASNIAIRVYVLDMWSVLCVMYVGGMFKYSDWNIAILDMWSVFCVPYVAVGI